MTKADMTALAERLEAATGDGADLFWEAFRLTQASNDPATFVRASQRFGELIDAKAFESAAMLLIGDDVFFHVSRFSPAEGLAGSAHVYPNRGLGDDYEADAATPAFALAAAAIRARASQEDE